MSRNYFCIYYCCIRIHSTGTSLVGDSCAVATRVPFDSASSTHPKSRFFILSSSEVQKLSIL